MDLFGVPADEQEQKCNCGRGWCHPHGTFHFSDATELLEIEQRQQQLSYHGTRGGTRVIRNQNGGDK